MWSPEEFTIIRIIINLHKETDQTSQPNKLLKSSPLHMHTYMSKSRHNYSADGGIVSSAGSLSGEHLVSGLQSFLLFCEALEKGEQTLLAGRLEGNRTAAQIPQLWKKKTDTNSKQLPLVQRYSLGQVTHDQRQQIHSQSESHPSAPWGNIQTDENQSALKDMAPGNGIDSAQCVWQSLDWSCGKVINSR